MKRICWAVALVALWSAGAPFSQPTSSVTIFLAVAIHGSACTKDRDRPGLRTAIRYRHQSPQTAFRDCLRRLDQQTGDAAQAPNMSVSGSSPSIRLYSVAGNHDVGNEPTVEALAAYRQQFGPDYYSFREGLFTVSF
jgi:hypothetical protein